MPAASDTISVEQQAINALSHLPPEDKQKVLEYIASLMHLAEVKNDQASVG